MPNAPDEASPGKVSRRLTVSVTEAAAILGIGRATAYGCVRTGQIPSIRLGGRIVVPIIALERLIGVDTDSAA